MATAPLPVTQLIMSRCHTHSQSRAKDTLVVKQAGGRLFLG